VAPATCQQRGLAHQHRGHAPHPPLLATGVALTTYSRLRAAIKIPGGALSTRSPKRATAALRTSGGALTTCRSRSLRPNAVGGALAARRSHSRPTAVVRGRATRRVRSRLLAPSSWTGSRDCRRCGRLRRVCGRRRVAE